MVVAQAQVAGDHLAAEVAGRREAGGDGDLLNVFGDIAKAQLVHEQSVEAHERDRDVGLESDRRNFLACGDHRQRGALGLGAQRGGASKAHAGRFAHQPIAEDQLLLGAVPIGGRQLFARRGRRRGARADAGRTHAGQRDCAPEHERKPARQERPNL